VIAGSGDLIDALAAAHPGQQVRLTILRGTRRITVTVKVATQPVQASSGWQR
jgi:S1-C subfamily serine protease